MSKVEIELLNKEYSTTRLVTKEKPSKSNNQNNAFKSVLFLSENKKRIMQDGLRIQNYFKKSYANKPLISIITVVYNGEEFLEETIQSVINQTYDNVEYIVIDGGSTDKTLEIIKKYEDKIDYWVSEKDNGIYDAMNKGIIASTGNLINFMNAGDRFNDNVVIEDVAKEYREDIKLIYGNTIFYNKILNRKKKQTSLEFTFKNITKYTTRVVCHQSMFINSKNIVLYDLQYKLKGELQLYFELAKQDNKFSYIDRDIAIFLEDGIGTQQFWANMKERLRVIRRFNNLQGLIISLPRITSTIILYSIKKFYK